MIQHEDRVADYVLNEEVVQAYRQTQNDWYEDGHAVSRFVQYFEKAYEVKLKTQSC